MARKEVLGAIAAVAVALLLLGTVLLLHGRPSNDSFNPESSLRIGFIEKIDSLNPYIGVSEAAGVFYGLVYDALTCADEDMNPAPNLAVSSWSVPLTDPDMLVSGEPFGSVWQYNLTTKAYWSDGVQFTADDVAWTINMNAKNYSDLWAYQPYSYFIDRAEALDDSTVRIHFFDRETGNPQPAAFGSFLPIHIMPKHKLESMGSSELGFSWRGVFVNESLPIVGTGPFTANSSILQDWLNRDVITLIRNPFYHFGPEYGKSIRFGKVVLKFFDDSLAMFYALRNGEIDVAKYPSGPYHSLKEDMVSGKLKNIQTHDGPMVTQYWTEVGIMQYDSGNPTRLDPVVQHALAMATNKSHIAKDIYNGFADEGSTLIPPVNSKWHYEPTPDELWAFDLDEANALLESNGYIDTDLDGVREATALSPSVVSGLAEVGTNLSYEMIVHEKHTEEAAIATYLKDQWSQIGIDMYVHLLDEVIWPTWYFGYEHYDMFVYHWYADIDPNLQLFASSSRAIYGWNDIYYHDDDYDENYNLSVREMDEEQRMEYVDNCQRIMYEDCSYVVVAYPYQTYAWRTDTFAGWGDWGAHPGRSMDNYWTANPLLFDLVPRPASYVSTYLGVVSMIAAAVIAISIVFYLMSRRGNGPSRLHASGEQLSSQDGPVRP